MEIKEYMKVKLKTGEMAWIDEVLKEGVAYIADIWQPEDGESKYRTEQISQSDIQSIVIEVEKPLNA